MKKEQFTALGISEDLAAKAEAASQEELKGYIPKARFDEVNTELKQARTDVTSRDAQLEALKVSTGAVDALKTQITELQKKNSDDAKTHAAEMRRVKRENVDAQLLGEAKAKNITAAKAMLTEIDGALDDEGYKALRLQQIKALTEGESTKFLFDDGSNAPTGMKPGESGDVPTAGGGAVNPFAQKTFDVEAQGKLFRENPEAARAMAKAAGYKLW